MKLSPMRQHGLTFFAQLLFGACLGVAGLNLRSIRDKALVNDGPLFPVAVNYDWKTYDPKYGVTIKMDKASGALKMVEGIHTDEDSAAWGYMKDELDKDGWIKLFLHTSDSHAISNDVRMYAAGFIEGLLTAVRISQFYSNVYQTIMKDENDQQALAVVRKVFEDELEFVKKNTNFQHGTVSVEPPDPYWKHMRYLFTQLWAVKDGYNFAAMGHGVRQLDLVDFLVINQHANLPELLQAYQSAQIKTRREFQANPNHDPSLLQGNGSKTKPEASLVNVSTNAVHNLTTQELVAVDHDWEMRLIKRGRCSALVRVAPENMDLLVGHTTWGDYSSMTRIYKYYHFSLPGASTKADQIGFSSYPGCISSTDDFYELSSGLVVLDTSLEILNMDLYNRVAEFPVNSHVPEFMHVMVANRMASTAPHWAVLYSERNSGIGNAQWMIVDYNRFVPQKPLPDGTLWLVEQVPGTSFKKDMTYILRDKGYWASYNRPYFAKIRDLSGHTEAESRYGALYSWDNGPRASIFKSVAPLAEHIMDMRSIMNRNVYPNENHMWKSEPGHAISARMDLSFSKVPNGGIDAKVINRCLFRSMQVQAISGPTHDKQRPFKWMDGAAEVVKGWPHLGLPNVFDFGWVQFSPTAKLNSLVDVNKCQTV